MVFNGISSETGNVRWAIEILNQISRCFVGFTLLCQKNGSTSALKTEENIDIFMNMVEDIVYDPNSLWFEEETYQASTDRELESITIYNEKHNRIVVFMRSTGEFIIFCEPTLNELEDKLRYKQA